VIGGTTGSQGNGPADALGGLAVIALLMQGDAQQVQGVGVVGLGAEDVAVSPGRLVQQSALVFLQAEGKLVVHGDALSILKGGRRRDSPRKAGQWDSVTWGEKAPSGQSRLGVRH
jgi:hypothetical protein